MEETEVISLKELKERMKIGQRFSVDSPDGFVDVTEFLEKGTKSTYTVHLFHTSILITGVTLDHLVLTDVGWRHVGVLNREQRILTNEGYFRFHSLEYRKEELVYDINVLHKNHRFYADSVCVHNCLQHLFAYNVFNHGHTCLIYDNMQCLSYDTLVEIKIID